MVIELTTYVKNSLKEISTCTESSYITLVCEENRIYFVGYTTTYFEIMYIDITPDLIGIFRIPSDIIKTICLYTKVDLKFTDTTINIACFRDKVLKGAIKVNREAQIDITSSNYVNMLITTNKYRVIDLSVLKKFSRIMSLTFGGLAFKDGYVYTEGQDFILYGVTDFKLNFLLTSEVISKIVKNLDDNVSMCDIDNYAICQKNNFFFGFKKMRQTNSFDITYIKKFDKLASYDVNVSALLSIIRGISDKDCTIGFNLQKNLINIRSKVLDMILLLDIDNKSINSEDVKIILKLELLKKILSTAEVVTVKFVIYAKFIVIYSGSLMYILKNII